MVLLAVFSLVILRDPGLGLTDFDFFDAFYFSIVTATTVGCKSIESYLLAMASASIKGTLF